MHKLIWIVGLGVFALGGCGSPKPIKYYAVQIPPAPSSSLTAVYPIDLVVKRLTGTPLLEAAPIVYRMGPNELGVYTYHRWDEAPVGLVQTRLILMLRGTGQYATVGDSSSVAGAEFVVRGRLYDFEEVSGSSLAGQVTMEFELYNRKNGKVLWTHYYSQTEPADGKEVTSVVQALERNLERGLKEVVAGLSQYFAANPPKKA
jgi:ABC-type uncharacterized transport system auxiliary subunit